MTSECGEVEHGEYQLNYDSFKMGQHCLEIHRRQQAGEPFGCSEMEKAAAVFISKDSAKKAVQTAKDALAKTMHVALAKDNAALAKAVQNATATKLRPQSSHQKTKNDQQPDWDQVYKQNYETKITPSQNWFRVANELLAAAEFLAPSILKWWEDMREWSKEKKSRPLSISFKLRI